MTSEWGRHLPVYLSGRTEPPARGEPVDTTVARRFILLDAFDPAVIEQALQRAVQSPCAKQHAAATHGAIERSARHRSTTHCLAV